jgi:hypothetical protein
MKFNILMAAIFLFASSASLADDPMMTQSKPEKIRSFRLAVGEALVFEGQKFFCQDSIPTTKESGVTYLTVNRKPWQKGDTIIRCGEGANLWERHALIDLEHR